MEDKSNEITAVPALLEMLALEGWIVTADAMHTRRVTAEAVIAGGGHYVLALKGNQSSLHDDVRLYLDDPAREDDLLSCQQFDGGHGRIEIRPRSVGVEHVGLWAMEQLGLPGLLERLGFNGPQRALAMANVIARLARPGSERASWRWLCERSALGELLGVDFERMSMMGLYRASDALLSRRAAIEKHLFDRATDLFGLPRMVTLYDLTNTFFEGGTAAQGKAERGHSKEKRSDCPLLTLGLVLNGSGFVRCSEVFSGAVNEDTTLASMLDALGAPADALVVMDAGIATEANIAWLGANGYRYLAVNAVNQVTLRRDIATAFGDASSPRTSRRRTCVRHRRSRRAVGGSRPGASRSPAKPSIISTGRAWRRSPGLSGGGKSGDARVSRSPTSSQACRPKRPDPSASWPLHAPTGLSKTASTTSAMSPSTRTGAAPAPLQGRSHRSETSPSQSFVAQASQSLKRAKSSAKTDPMSYRPSRQTTSLNDPGGPPGQSLLGPSCLAAGPLRSERALKRP